MIKERLTYLYYTVCVLNLNQIKLITGVYPAGCRAAAHPSLLAGFPFYYCVWRIVLSCCNFRLQYTKISRTKMPWTKNQEPKNQEPKNFQIPNCKGSAIFVSPCNLSFCISSLEFDYLYFFFGSWHLGSWFFCFSILLLGSLFLGP